ncbi:glycogen debranching N-terminal domain-containing protein [Actinomadura sp. DC4]|uniref:glycogen debranching N-terminal domain-containing protein n=1 Tax=Actinomadura sp. DC4 TaxID=3055069 RepID=UPI0025B124AA|nr:glycogen debranching N-terminal domain-containing protein [Actinomadura sp. DC4]MDN3355251.1 glycogen debranching N-terminal domain-containing protein [Actinomadura sp. DC4]
MPPHALRRPALDEHLTCLAAPATWLSPPSGQLTGGVDGLYVSDRRVLSRLRVTVGGAEPRPVAATRTGAGGARFTAAAGPLAVERVREVACDGGTERITVRNTGDRPVTTEFAVTVAADLAEISAVKAGDPPPPETPLHEGTVEIGGYRIALTGSTRATLTLAPGEHHTTTLGVRATPPRAPGFHPAPPAGPPPWGPLKVEAADGRFGALVAQGVADLGVLLLADEGDLYCAAGSPWYLTLFGRDALWSARLALPLGHELAAGTLRALARHQGTGHDPVTEEEPGKIPHELRPAYAPGRLPPVYYGSVDATALFVVTLAEAWRWGMPAAEVEELLPAVRAALAWLGSFEEFVSYRGSAERLPNQGWKDSSDGVQHEDGTRAAPPIALAEVQAYAYQAATLGADLLEAFGGAADRSWAEALAVRFRDRFWLEEGYPAIALDGEGRPVDGLASNIGHLPGTGLLTPEEETRVAERLMELHSGWGLRTLTDRAAGYDPVSYHLGSVWPHDTAIAMLGLSRSGHHGLAARLARGLVGAAPAFGHRLPELFSGERTGTPRPYPAACRPQAWSAAVSPALVTVLLGLDPDVPAGRLGLAPLRGVAARVEGVRIGAATLAFELDGDGGVTAEGVPPELAVRQSGSPPRRRR